MRTWWQTLKPHRVILLIVLAALVIRCWDLGNNPPGFFRDEADKAVTAYSLLTTGRDLEGRFLPYFVRSLSVYTAGAYQYLLIPFIVALGLGEWVIRLPAALAGTATVGLTYLVGKEAYDRRTGLWAAALLAISPWHVQFSRWANQGILLPLCMSLGVWFFLRGRRRFVEEGEELIPAGSPRFRYLTISAVFLSLALYTYEPAKVFLPLLLILLVFIYWRDFFAVVPNQRWPYFYKFVGLILILGIPISYFTFWQTERSLVRFDRISILGEGDNFRDLFFLFFQNYLLHFGKSFLVISGDANLRHSVHYVGQLLWPEAMALLLGLYALLRRHRREDFLLLSWLLLGPVPAALTREGIPHALRSIAILPAVQLIAAGGCVRFLEYFSYREQKGVFRSAAPRRVATATLVAAFVLFEALYLYALFFLYPRDAAPWWEYGYRQAIGYLEQHRRDYEGVVVSGWTQYPEIHVLYYTRSDPAVYRKTRTIPGYRFLPFSQPYEADFASSRKDSLYLLTPNDPLRGELVYQVNFPDGSLAWTIVRHSGTR